MKKNFFKFLSLTIITSLFINSFVIIDGMFIGSKLGDVGLSAINLSWPITAFLQSIGVALGISAGIYISRLKGLGNIEEANKAKWNININFNNIYCFRNIILYICKAIINFIWCRRRCFKI